MKIISKETSKRVCDHMNNDHIDSVHKYLFIMERYQDLRMLIWKKLITVI